MAVYWIALFAATHTPPSQAVVVHTSDKLLHTAAFAGLAFLLAMAWSLSSAFTWRSAAAAVAILAVYAAVDEATQPLVDRHADLLDWTADTAGILLGLAVFLAARAIWRRASKTAAG